MYSFSVLIAHLTTSSFRWEGEFTPEIRGPTAFAYSEVLPLPSTIAGVIAYINWKNKNKCMDEDPFSSTRRILLENLGAKFSIRGPYFYVRASLNDEGKEHEVICLHKYPKELLCINISSKRVVYIVTEEVGVQHVGIALRDDTKSTIEGLIYTQVEFSPKLLAEIIVKKLVGNKALVKEYGILAEVFCSSENCIKSVKEDIIVVGGESRPALFKTMSKTPLYKFLENEWKKTSIDDALLYIASPIVSSKVHGHHINESVYAFTSPRDYVSKYVGELLSNYIKAEKLTVRSYIVSPTKGVELKRHRTIFTVIGLGYDLCLNIPRPIHKSIMPGALFEAAIKDWKQLYIGGIGEYREFGWGTVIPIPTTTLNTLELKVN